MRETKLMMAINFKIWTKFTKIFLKLNDHMNPLISEPIKLKREY